MVYISAHKDFNLKNIDFFKEHYDEFSIIDGGELQNNYPINIVHETELNNSIYHFHNLFGEISRQYFIYKNLNTLA